MTIHPDSICELCRDPCPPGALLTLRSRYGRELAPYCTGEELCEPCLEDTHDGALAADSDARERGLDDDDYPY